MKTGISKSDSRTMTNRAITMALIVVVLVFAVLYALKSSRSLGWFAQNREVDATGLQVVVAQEGYDLLIDTRGTEYDAVLPDGAKYPGIDKLKELLEGQHYNDSDAYSTSDASRLAFELNNEFSMSQDNVDYNIVMPGAFGTLTFYIRPKADFHEDHVDLVLSIAGFADEIGDNNESFVTEVTDPLVCQLLRGHILFFRGRTGTANSTSNDYEYTDMIDIESGEFTVDLSGTPETVTVGEGGDAVSYEGCYKVELYWEWPMTFYDITEGAVSGKFPAELGTMAAGSRSYFLTNYFDSADPELLSDGYNDADQTIGEHANYLVVFISPGMD